MGGTKSKENFSIVFLADETNIMSYCGHTVWVGIQDGAALKI